MFVTKSIRHIRQIENGKIKHLILKTMKTIEKEKLIAGGAVIFLIVALIATGVFYNSNKTLTKQLNTEKLNSEMMLSQKLELQKEIEAFKEKVASLNGKNAELDKFLTSTTQKLLEREAELKKIKRENGNVKQLKKQLAELEDMKKDFESQLVVLNESIQKLTAEKNNLNKTIASLQEENKQLAENLKIISSMTADNYMVETTKRKDKLTVVARRAKKMSVSFKVPDNVVDDISFKIIKPDGKVVEGKDNGIAYRVLNPEEGLMASTEGGAIQVSRKIEMTYQPKEKQKPGIYKIEMYNADKYVGTVNVRLR